LVNDKPETAAVILDNIVINKTPKGQSALISYFMFIALKCQYSLTTAWILQKNKQVEESLGLLKESFEFLSSSLFSMETISFDSLVLNYWIETVMFTHIMTLCSIS
jgi:hypothetical protein